MDQTKLGFRKTHTHKKKANQAVNQAANQRNTRTKKDDKLKTRQQKQENAR